MIYLEVGLRAIHILLKSRALIFLTMPGPDRHGGIRYYVPTLSVFILSIWLSWPRYQPESLAANIQLSTYPKA